MNPKNSVSSSTLLHCQFRSASSQRFCRMAVSEQESGLCLKHAAAQKQDIATRLIGDTGEFPSAVTINRSLGEILKPQAREEISPRRIAVLAYTCNLLLRTLPAIDRELHPEDGRPIRLDISGWDRADPVEPDPIPVPVKVPS